MPATDRAPTSTAFVWYALALAGPALAIGFLIWGGLAFFYAVLVGLAAVPLASAARRLFKRGDFAWLIAGLAPPTFLWIQYGAGGVEALLDLNEGKPSIFSYSDVSIVVCGGIAALAALTYVVGFRACYRREAGDGAAEQAPRSALAMFTLVLFVIDLVVRLYMIREGSYSKWASDQGAGAGISMFRDSLGAGVVALAAHLGASGRRRLFWYGLVALDLAFFAGTGSRKFVLLGLIAVVSSLAFTMSADPSRRQRVRRLFYVGAGALVLFFGIISPIVQEARYRAMAAAAAGAGASTPRSFLVDHVPSVLSYDVLYGDESIRLNRGATLDQRLASMAAVGGAIVTQRLDGAPLMPLADAAAALPFLVPSAIIGERRERLQANNRVIEYYSLGRTTIDAPTTSMTDIYVYLDVVGVALLFFVVGCGFGALASVLRRGWGRAVGGILSLVLLYNTIPLGGSYLDYLVRLRNAAVLVALLVGLFHLCKGAVRGPSLRPGRAPVYGPVPSR